MNARDEFARIQRARERLAPDDPADAKLARREADLLREHRDDWQVNDFRDVFRGGAVVEVTLDAYREKPTLKSLMAKAPLEKVTLSGPVKGAWAKRFLEPSLTRLHEVVVQNDAGHAAFMKSPFARSMRRLELTAADAKLVAKGGFAVTEASNRLDEDPTWVTKLGPALATMQVLKVAHASDATLALLAREAVALKALVLEEPTGTLAPLAALSKRLGSLEVTAELTPTQGAMLARCRVTRLFALVSDTPLLPLLKKLGEHLESLRLPSRDVRLLDEVAFPRLRELVLYRPTHLPKRFPPSLTSLRIDAATDLTDEHLRALKASKVLRELTLDFCELGDAQARLFVNWPKNAGLHTLSLNGNHVLDAGVRRALEERFGIKRFDSVGLAFGYQHPLEEPKPVVPEPPPPKQRPAPKPLPRRRDGLAGLKELVGRAHFASWDGYVDAKLIARGERLIDDCARALQTAPEAKQLAVLRRCIAGFNRFSDSLHTIEAEDIMTTFNQLVRYTKYAGEEDLADRWRDF
ncbi:MAG: hypothetical protein JNM69_26520 [Archangium sp.]|nr:hypothetical protein [Archangium sp.]